MGSRPASHLFAELVHVLHDESDALVANDSARLLDAANRKEHLLRLLAPQANALRAMRRSGSDELERFAREAAQLMALDSSPRRRGPEFEPGVGRRQSHRRRPGRPHRLSVTRASVAVMPPSCASSAPQRAASPVLQL